MPDVVGRYQPCRWRARSSGLAANQPMVNRVPGTSSTRTTLICWAKQASNVTGAPMNRFVPAPETLTTLPAKSSSARGNGQRAIEGAEKEEVKSVSFPVDHVRHVPLGQGSSDPERPVIPRRLQLLTTTGAAGLLIAIDVHSIGFGVLWIGAAEAASTPNGAAAPIVAPTGILANATMSLRSLIGHLLESPPSCSPATLSPTGDDRSDARVPRIRRPGSDGLDQTAWIRRPGSDGLDQTAWIRRCHPDGSRRSPRWRQRG